MVKGRHLVVKGRHLVVKVRHLVIKGRQMVAKGRHLVVEGSLSPSKVVKCLEPGNDLRREVTTTVTGRQFVPRRSSLGR